MTYKRFDLVERERIVNLSQAFLAKPEGKAGLDYLLNERKLSPAVIRRFSLGYLPTSYDHQLAGRIILPIYDASANLISISSRAIREDDRRLPKYWHENYEKSFYLYGLHIAKQAMRKWKFAIITEGQIDAIQLHNHGMTNAVALCGVNFHRMQLCMIYRYCQEIVFILDKDENRSGEKGIEKITKSLKELDFSELSTYNLKIGIARFDDTITGKVDTDSYIIKYGIGSMNEIIKKTVKGMRKQT